VCRIVADQYERAGGVVEALGLLGVEVGVTRLPVGDYDLGRGVLVERKTATDLHLSLQRGRLWRQVAAIRDSARLPYLLVEGLDNGGLATNGIRGVCLAVLGQGVPVLFSRDPFDSAAWLRLLALRASGVRPGRDRPVYAQRLKPRAEQVREAMLTAVPGISVKRARALLGRFGSVRNVAAATEAELQSVTGIGPVLAHALDCALS